MRDNGSVVPVHERVLRIVVFSLAISRIAQADSDVLFTAAVGGFKPGSWHVLCQQDPIEDTKLCMIQSQLGEDSLSRSTFSVFVQPGVGLSASASGSSPYPGSKMTVRVDEKPPVSIDAESFWKSSTHATLFRQLREGSLARARWYEFPYEHTPIDEEIPLDGLDRAIEIAKQALAGKVKLTTEEAATVAENLGTSIGIATEQLGACGQPTEAAAIVNAAKAALAGHLELLEASMQNARALRLSLRFDVATCREATREAARLKRQVALIATP